MVSRGEDEVVEEKRRDSRLQLRVVDLGLVKWKKKPKLKPNEAHTPKFILNKF